MDAGRSNPVVRGFVLPLLQSAIPGAAVGFLGGVVAGIVVGLLTWLYLLGRWLAAEYGGAVVFEPDQTLPVDVVRVELRSDQGRAGQWINLPANLDQLRTLAGGLLAGVSFSESAWCGWGKPFTKDELHELRDELVLRGLVRWRNPLYPAQGLELTGPGRAVMRKLSPSPSEDLRGSDL
jgi:hypothetical protein